MNQPQPIGEAITNFLVDLAKSYLPEDIVVGAKDAWREGLGLPPLTTEATNDQLPYMKAEVGEELGFDRVQIDTRSDWVLADKKCWKNKCDQPPIAGIKLATTGNIPAHVYAWCNTHNPELTLHVEDGEEIEAMQHPDQNVDVVSWFKNVSYEQDPDVEDNPDTPDNPVFSAEANNWHLVTLVDRGNVRIVRDDGEVIHQYTAIDAPMARALVGAHNQSLLMERKRFHDLVYVKANEAVEQVDARLDEVLAKKWSCEPSKFHGDETPGINIVGPDSTIQVSFKGDQAGLAQRIVNAHNRSLGL